MKYLKTALISGFFALPQLAAAEVTNFEVTGTAPAFDGAVFATGGYELVNAIAEITLNPKDPKNAVVTDIDLMPVDESGNVTFTAPVQMIRPADASRGSGKLLYDVVNRGRIAAMMFLNDSPPPGADFSAAATAGNGYLMDQGYTVLWSGWQGDIGGQFGLSLPALDVTGISREEIVFGKPDQTTLKLTYPMADASAKGATLTVRNREADARETPQDLTFTVTDDSTIEINRPTSASPGAIYEFIYEARDPVAMGLGLAAVRDVTEYVATHPDVAHQPDGMNVYGFGSSQSGRFLKEFVNLGFNQAEDGQQVFDGILAHVTGSRRIFLNQRFAQAGRYSRQHEDHLYPGDDFPFSYFDSTDPLTGRTGSILDACKATKTCPRIMHIDSAAEAYQARVSLVVTDPQGKTAVMPDNVRLYYAVGVPHGVPVGIPSKQGTECSAPTNNLPGGIISRAVLANLDAWVHDGTEPPSSRYPSLEDGTLVDPDTLDFSGIPGIQAVPVWNGKSVVDRDQVPPVEGAAYPVFLPRLDSDGHATAGIRLPEIDAGLGTYLGWNTRPGTQEPLDLCSTTGSLIPFAKTRDEAEATGDKRASLEERYPDAATYAAKVKASVDALVADRLILPFDGAAIISKAEEGLPQ
ncbi:hypothetical protein LA6_002189 [Marinibacterium anthonyi]|nr:hypothetical protein LA6_002189 [Marinibacterium anthonyi]